MKIKGRKILKNNAIGAYVYKDNKWVWRIIKGPKKGAGFFDDLFSGKTKSCQWFDKQLKTKKLEDIITNLQKYSNDDDENKNFWKYYYDNVCTKKGTKKIREALKNFNIKYTNIQRLKLGTGGKPIIVFKSSNENKEINVLNKRLQNLKNEPSNKKNFGSFIKKQLVTKDYKKTDNLSKTLEKFREIARNYKKILIFNNLDESILIFMNILKDKDLKFNIEIPKGSDIEYFDIYNFYLALSNYFINEKINPVMKYLVNNVINILYKLLLSVNKFDIYPTDFWLLFNGIFIKRINKKDYYVSMIIDEIISNNKKVNNLNRGLTIVKRLRSKLDRYIYGNQKSNRNKIRYSRNILVDFLKRNKINPYVIALIKNSSDDEYIKVLLGEELVPTDNFLSILFDNVTKNILRPTSIHMMTFEKMKEIYRDILRKNRTLINRISSSTMVPLRDLIPKEKRIDFNNIICSLKGIVQDKNNKINLKCMNAPEYLPIARRVQDKNSEINLKSVYTLENIPLASKVNKI